MKLSTITMILVIGICMLNAQTTSLIISSENIDKYHQSYIAGKVLDAEGNLYVVFKLVANSSDHIPGIKFEMQNRLEKQTKNCMYIVKTNKKGDLIWDNVFYGTFSIYTIFSSTNQGVIIAGSSKDLKISQTIINDGFIMELNSDGSLVWVKKLPKMIDFRQDDMGNLNIIGVYTGSVTFGTIVLKSSNLESYYVAKIDKLGNWVLAQNITSIEVRAKIKDTIYTFDPQGSVYVGKNEVFNSQFKYIKQNKKTDKNGNVYSVGVFGEMQTNYSSIHKPKFGNFTLTTKDPSSSYPKSLGYELFATKQDSTGSYLWAVQIGGPGDQSLLSWTLDESGNVYILGCPNFCDVRTKQESIGHFIVMLSSSGKWVWAISLDSNINPSSIVASKDDVYLFSNVSYMKNPCPILSVVVMEKPNISLIYPDGGEKLQANVLNRITWQPTPSLGSIVCKLSIDNGRSWITLNSAPIDGGKGYFDFTVPSIESESCLVRLEAVLLPEQLFDVSTRTFTITSMPQPSINLTKTPSRGQKILKNGEFVISWESSMVDFVTIEASFNGGRDWGVVASDLNTRAMNYQWTVPDQVSKHCLLKISDSNNPSIFNINYDEFSICRLDIQNPKPGTSLRAGIEHKIQINSEGIDLVNIDVSYDGGVTWSQLSKNLRTNDINVKWAMPDEAYEKILIRVSDVEQSSISTISTYDNLPFLKLSDPAERAYQDKHFERSKAKQPLVVGKDFLISWKSRNIEGPYQLEYSVDNGKTYTFIIDDLPSEQNSYNWDVPFDLANKEIQIRISLMYDPTFNSICKYGKVRHYEFTDFMEVKILYSGSNFKIQYTGGYAQFHFSSDGGTSWESIGPEPGIITGDRFKQPINWVVPPLNSDRCLLKLSALDHLRVKQHAGDYREYAIVNPWEITTVSKEFSIKKAITLQYPIGGDKLTTNSIEKIRWKSEKIVSKVTIEISYDNGASWEFIQSIPIDSSTGEYSWIVPEMTSDHCKLRIRDSQNSNISGESEHVFSISN